jgi:sodium-coupled neutral amino acid transporter 11
VYEVTKMTNNNIELSSFNNLKRTYTPPGSEGELENQNENIAVSQNKLTKPLVKSGLGGASANLVNSIVGAGIIGIPYAIKESGLLAGVILLVLVSWLTDKSLRVIVGLAAFHPKLKNKDVRTFEDLASYPFGQAGINFILFSMFLMAYGAMVAYLLIIKDTLPTILGLDNVWERILIMMATSVMIMLPLSLQRDMASLSITSLFSVVADAVLVIFIAAYSPVSETVAQEGGFLNVLKMDAVNPTIFVGLGILSTAMACQHSAFIVSGSLENRTMKRWAQVTGFSLGTSLVLCSILGITGYLGFLDETEGNLLNNFDDESTLANLSRLLLAVTMFFTYPMESFVARHVAVQLLHGGDMDGKDDPNHSGKEGEEAGGIWIFNRRQAVTIIIFVLTLIPAIIVDDLGMVLSINGSIAGGCIAYLAPGLCYLGCFGDEFLVMVNSWIGVNDVHGTSTDELPVAGEAGNVLVPMETSKKPIWWYLCGFPLWCKIAKVGSNNMHQKLNNEDSWVEADNEDDIMVPSKKEFLIAIFFIIFGSVSLVLGIVSNIYVQLNED